MKMRLCVSLLLLLAVLLMLGPPAPADEKKNEKNNAVLGSEWWCALYKVQDHGSYCTYYSKHCDPVEYGKIDFPSCSLTPTGNECNKPGPPNCVEVQLFKKGDSPQHVHPDLKKGIAPGEVILNPIPRESRAFVRLLGRPVLADLGAPANAKVVLYVTLVNPPQAGKEGDPLIFASGLEVKTAQAAEVSITKGITVADRVARVQFGAVTYTVILGKIEKK